MSSGQQGLDWPVQPRHHGRKGAGGLVFCLAFERFFLTGSFAIGAATTAGRTATESRSVFGRAGDSAEDGSDKTSVLGRLDKETCDIAALRSTLVSMTSWTTTCCLSWMILVRMPRACISRAALRSDGVMKDSSVPDGGDAGAAQPGKIKATVNPKPINVFMPSFRCCFVAVWVEL